MALAAGRVGVSPQDVDNRGHITTGGMTPEQAAKLDRALVAPITAPLENEMVGIGTGNDQIMIKLGKGVKLSGATSPYTITLDPAPTAADAGKVLTVTGDGGLEWHEAGGGGGACISFPDLGSPTIIGIKPASSGNTFIEDENAIAWVVDIPEDVSYVIAVMTRIESTSPDYIYIALVDKYDITISDVNYARANAHTTASAQGNNSAASPALKPTADHNKLFIGLTGAVSTIRGIYNIIFG